MKKSTKIPAFLFIILSLNLYICGNAQQVSVETRFDTTFILTGDQINFTITLEKQADLNLSLQHFKDTLVSGIEILRGPLLDTIQLNDNRIAIHEKYLITSFDSGKYEIPPIYAEMMTEEGIKRFYSDYTYLIVKRPDITPADTTMKYFDIIGPYRVPVTAGEILPWVLILFVVSGLAWFLYRYFKNRRSGNIGQVPEEPTEAAYIIAYRSLEKLKNEKLWQKGLFKEYFSRMSDILRTYLDHRYSMNSMESTTSEILSNLVESSNVGAEPLERLKQVLEISDMVKFAKYLPDPSDCQLSMEHSWSFVSLTRKAVSYTHLTLPTIYSV